MTVLNDYARLECTGGWRADGDSPVQDVGVSLGKTSLVLLDNDNRPLSHWSLPAIVGIRGDVDVVQLRPGPGSSETLVLDDPDMIAALAHVRHTIDKTAARPGRLRLLFGATAVGALAWLGLIWLPNAVPRRAANILPDVREAELGDQIVGAMAQLVGAPCASPEGRVALDHLARRMAVLGNIQLHVMPVAQNHVIALPGQGFVIPQDLIEVEQAPDVIAGHIIAASTGTLSDDPLAATFETAGTWATLRYMTGKSFGVETLGAVAEHMLTGTAPHPASQTMIQGFEALGISAAPFANATGRSDLATIDPHPTGTPSEIIPDGAWLGLKSICLSDG